MSVLLLLAITLGIPERDANGLPHLRSESVVVRRVGVLEAIAQSLSATATRAAGSFASPAAATVPSVATVTEGPVGITGAIGPTDRKEIVLSKNPHVVRPIASVTKVLTALVLDRLQKWPTQDFVTIDEVDKDRLKWSRSRIPVGRSFRGDDLLFVGLLASDNRAIYAVVRHAGFERRAFVGEMNRFAQELGMRDSRFADPAGVDPDNVSTAEDLLLLIEAGAELDSLRAALTAERAEITDLEGRALSLSSTNRLVRSSRWDVLLGKTGYTTEAGRTLVLRVVIEGTVFDMVFLGSREWASIFGDAGRVGRWIRASMPRRPATRPRRAAPRA